ncbi:MAG: sn-glycerol-3-phosphate ABC transporter ATP-binding protein UgpC [Phycisphaerae bacterium]|nr:sn-glycerol-3-phosphate ABC transporter ATP-binding protein UgpC [Phycisphaerae bacterium]
MARVLLENVIKIFDGEITAINNISLDIVDKEFMVIVGPSGCGKTTILRMIAGLEDITKGAIMIDGKVVNNTPPKDRDIAMVFQNYALYPHMTVYQNMAFGLKLRKYPKSEIKQRVEEAAKILGIEQLLDRKPKALSGGQRQRVALGRAIVRHPKAFLFDEPLSSLDAKLRITTRTELKALHHRLQTTSIYVTHDQIEAMILGDRICVMHNGVIQQFAAPMLVYDMPVNRFVAGFLGTPPMNFFDGRIEFKANKAYFIDSQNSICLPARMKDKLAGYNNKEVVLGIRPENLSLQPYIGQEDNCISGVVRVIEPLGNKVEVHFEITDGIRFIANVDAHIKMKIDECVLIYMDIEKSHIFELGETGINIGT